ncbi:hypothetical protein D3C71_1502630 [compost metagenome]
MFFITRNMRDDMNSSPAVAGTNIMAVCIYRLIWTIFRAIRLTILLTPIGALEAVAINAPLNR